MRANSCIAIRFNWRWVASSESARLTRACWIWTNGVPLAARTARTSAMAISSGTSNASISTFSLGRRRTEYSTSNRASLSNRGSCIELLRFHSTAEMQLAPVTRLVRNRAHQFGNVGAVQLVHKRAEKFLFHQFPPWRFPQEFLHRFFVFLRLEAACAVDQNAAWLQ